MMKSTGNKKLTRKVTIPNELGLHARAGGKIAQIAEEARFGVFIMKNGKETDAKSLLDVVSLYCPCGTEVTVGISDPADTKVLNRIVRLIESGFGEL